MAAARASQRYAGLLERIAKLDSYGFFLEAVDPVSPRARARAAGRVGPPLLRRACAPRLRPAPPAPPALVRRPPCPTRRT